MILAGAAIVLERRRKRDPFSVQMVSDRTKLVIALFLIFMGGCILLVLFFPDFKPPVKFKG